jgi:Ni/Co efflux regulator RcnB
MRKLLLMSLIVATAMPSVADARRREVRHDRREVRHDRQELRQDRRNGASPGELREDRRELREDRRELREDRRDRRHLAYVAPYRGWVYRPITRGYVLRPVFWGPAYAIDYAFYRLAAPRRDQRWIRYGDDLVLVNIHTGRVIEVIPNRF